MIKLTFPQKRLLTKIRQEQAWSGRGGYLVKNWNEERTAMALAEHGLIAIVRYEKVNARPGSFQSRPFCKTTQKGDECWSALYERNA